MLVNPQRSAPVISNEDNTLCFTPDQAPRKRKANQSYHRGKRTRSNAALQERVRFKVFKEALEALQSVLPVRLPKGRKLHQKQTIQFASSYIKFLRGCLEGTQSWHNRHRFLWYYGSSNDGFLNAIDAAANGLAIDQAFDIPQGVPDVQTHCNPQTQYNGTRPENQDGSDADIDRQPAESIELTRVSELAETGSNAADCGILDSLLNGDCQDAHEIESFQSDVVRRYFSSSNNILTPFAYEDVVNLFTTSEFDAELNCPTSVHTEAPISTQMKEYDQRNKQPNRTGHIL